ncbi:MAG: energy transducer TonB [Bacteroidia bacterium]
MTPKKSEKANLERYRSAFFQLGLVVALSVSLVAFEWVSPALEKVEFSGKMALEEEPYIIPEIIPKKEEPTQQKKTPTQQTDKPSEKYKVEDSLKIQTEKKIPDIPIIDFGDKGKEDSVFIETGITTSTFKINEVDVLPEFPGGRKALKEFLADNTKYPHQARERNVMGEVKVSFVIDENGFVTDVKLINDIGYNCGKEAMRVVNSMPQWKPARISGKAVPVYYQVKINFLLK